MKYIFCLLLLTVACITQAAEGTFPISKSYGFDWLHPKTAKCKPVPEEVTRLKSCEYKTDSGFTGDAELYSCKPNRKQEFLIFKDKATCQAQLETMEANAP
jgi:hypothetical protein